jgi:hypothetical protein
MDGVRPAAAEDTAVLGTVAALRRYPVKSMLGEELAEAEFTGGGVTGDRALALLDVETGRVATAKHPRLWRGLLRFSATRDGASVRITLPDGGTVRAGDAEVDHALSRAVGRRVHLSDVRPAGAMLERPSPQDVLEHGDDADVPYETMEMSRGTTGGTFVDFAPVHLITTATLDQIGAEALRYRPNLVVDTPAGAPFAENDWVGREITAGAVRLRGVELTPRCAVPTLEHGELPRAPHAVRAVLAQNRVEIPGSGLQPCAGLYCEVLAGGTIRAGETVRLH